LRTEYILDREVDLILAALTPKNRLVIRTALTTGLRVGDVLALKPERLKPHFWVTEQKTGKKRQVGLPEPLLSDLKKHAGKHWVFPGRDPKKHHTRQAVWKDVKRAAKLFRLPQNVAPHSFRKVYAVELMQKYGDIDRVRRALNHGSETITMIYALADTQMKAKYKRRRNASGRKKS
jgi:integrase